MPPKRVVPKRAAVERATVIVELSDSDEDANAIPKKRRRDEGTNRTIDTAGSKTQRQNEADGKTGKTQRWTTVEKPMNTIEPTRTCNDSPIRVAGRSSFWERRKVWTIPELLAETQSIEPTVAHNITRLFDTENTIPFICRYRRDLINHLPPERLRDIKSAYGEIQNLRKKAENIVTQLSKTNQIDEDTRIDMLCAKTTEELEFLYAPFKPVSKGSLVERAKALGLEPYADRILFGEAPQLHLEAVVDRNNDDLNTINKVISGICHIISHNMSKHTEVLEEMRRLQKTQRIMLVSSKAKTSAKSSKTAPSSSSLSSSSSSKAKSCDESKFELYFHFECDVRSLRPHQILAINRGEKLKFLNVKIAVPESLKSALKQFIRGRYMRDGLRYELRHEVFEKALDECWSKKLHPLLTRQVLLDLNEAAKKAQIDVFAKNLKQLLLMSPLKGERICGIDPGFTNGCKFAIISETADVLKTGTVYPHNKYGDADTCGEYLAKLLIKHKCNVIALGDGTACRETESWLSKMFLIGILDPKFVRYCIVSEQGASIYSCSDLARQEFPDMDVNQISAVSIARRLNDPLSEYVKIEPRHIGVGMYQHDMNDKSLTETLNDVVSECVSFVGVDINTASVSVLKHIAGLSQKKAEKIIEYRSEHGPFRTREDLLKVPKIGEKTFTQCAGFVRIEPRSVGGSVENLLDCTWVHPESYATAKKIISKCGLQLRDIGQAHFVQQVKDFVSNNSLDDLAKNLKQPPERVKENSFSTNLYKSRLEIVLEALQRELFKDYRTDVGKRPLFKQGIARMADLTEGDVVTGAVKNVTHFGVFVDIGVEVNGLIHTTKLNGAKLNIGDRITASIMSVDKARKRIGLRFMGIINESDGNDDTLTD